jgi:hypothetical protein
VLVEHHDQSCADILSGWSNPGADEGGCGDGEKVPIVFITCATAHQTRLCQRSPRILHVSRGSP